MTAPDSSGTQSQTLPRSVFTNREECVLRTGRPEPAALALPREPVLISAYQRDKRARHGRRSYLLFRDRCDGDVFVHEVVAVRPSAPTTSRSSSARLKSTAPAPAPKRYVQPGSSRPARARTISRSRRRSRLRTTAVPTGRPIANATAGGVAPPARSTRIAMGPARCRRAPARARKISRPRTRRIRPKAWPGPDGAGL